MHEDVYLNVFSFGQPVTLISVSSKLKFLVMYWPGMESLLSIVAELWKEKLAELEKNSAKSNTRSKFFILKFRI